ncbi:MAG: hypothetical protein IV100_04125 [Myxococcales bacterium]|nr:hypothetical protein [Myxococcales bacterium]
MTLAPCLMALLLASVPPPPPDVVTVDPALLVNRLIEWKGAQALRGKRVTAEAVPEPGSSEYGVVTFHVVDPALTPELRYTVTLDVERTTGRPRDNAAQRETVIGRVQTARSLHREARASAPYAAWAASAAPRFGTLSQVGTEACIHFVGGTARTALLTFEACSSRGVTRYEADAWLENDAILNDLRVVAGAGPVERVSLTRRPGELWVGTVVREGRESSWERKDGGAWVALLR